MKSSEVPLWQITIEHKLTSTTGRTTDSLALWQLTHNFFQVKGCVIICIWYKYWSIRSNLSSYFVQKYSFKLKLNSAEFINASNVMNESWFSSTTKSPSMIGISLSTSDLSPSLELGAGVLDLVGGHDFFPFVLNRNFFGFLAVLVALRLRLSNMAASWMAHILIDREAEGGVKCGEVLSVGQRHQTLRCPQHWEKCGYHGCRV